MYASTLPRSNWLRRASIRLAWYRHMPASSWISLSLRPKTETKRLSVGLNPMLSLTNHSHASSLTSSAIHRWFCRMSLFIFELVKSEVIFTHQNLISNWLAYAKSTSELISFEISGRSVRSLVSANRWVQTKKNDFTFWLIFGLSPKLGLSETLSERLIQRVKWPDVVLKRCRHTMSFLLCHLITSVHMPANNITSITDTHICVQ